MSDCWRAYSMIGADGTYTHLTVNHKYNFVYPDTGAHTQNIERTWRSAKKRNKKHSVAIFEFLWRSDVKRRDADAFEEIIKTIKQYILPK
uniref:Uncharacterized protein n=1 Tax=Meloidogyne enterolobii TaxID=390850 RepID=A0A6V7VHJ9_MELEN|nr:unnamed protein product [Meloidogyne enterolobii]